MVSAFSFAANVPLGNYRQHHTTPFSWQWWVAIHASVPAIIVVRRALGLGAMAIPFNIAAAVAGQYVGGQIDTDLTQYTH
jgi:hypothetical protein